MNPYRSGYMSALRMGGTEGNQPFIDRLDAMSDEEFKAWRDDENAEERREIDDDWNSQRALPLDKLESFWWTGEGGPQFFGMALIVAITAGLFAWHWWLGAGAAWFAFKAVRFLWRELHTAVHESTDDGPYPDA